MLSFEEALPFALRIGRAYARRFPNCVDVDSVVMEALWKAIASGAELTLIYLKLRMQGALRDEMRSWAAGTRAAPISPAAFVDVDEVYTLSAEPEDHDTLLDRERLLGEMSREAVQLVSELARGRSQVAVASDLGVSAARMSQVFARIAHDPRCKVKIPGRIDLYTEVQRILREETRRHAGRATSYTEVTRRLGPSGWNWVTNATKRVSVRARSLAPSPVRDAARVRILALVEDAFRRNGGRFPQAAKALSVSPMTAYRWSRLLPGGVVQDRSNRRPDLSDAQVVELRSQGLGVVAIARTLGIARSTVRERLRRHEKRAER
jgi:transposase